MRRGSAAVRELTGLVQGQKAVAGRSGPRREGALARRRSQAPGLRPQPSPATRTPAELCPLTNLFPTHGDSISQAPPGFPMSFPDLFSRFQGEEEETAR